MSNFANPRTVTCQVPLSMEFSRQEYWSGELFPSPEDLLNIGIEPGTSALQIDSLLLSLRLLSHQFPLFTCSVVSDSLWPHGLEHASLCLSPPARACSDSCPLNRWCYTTILSYSIPLSSCLQFFPASGSFLMSQLFTLRVQNIGASDLSSVLPMNYQGWFPLE